MVLMERNRFMAHQGMPELFLDTTVIRVSKTNGKYMFDCSILILYWRIGYIMNAATVCKYIAT